MALGKWLRVLTFTRRSKNNDILQGIITAVVQFVFLWRIYRLGGELLKVNLISFVDTLISIRRTFPLDVDGGLFRGKSSRDIKSFTLAYVRILSLLLRSMISVSEHQDVCAIIPRTSFLTATTVGQYYPVDPAVLYEAKLSFVTISLQRYRVCDSLSRNDVPLT